MTIVGNLLENAFDAVAALRAAPPARKLAIVETDAR